MWRPETTLKTEYTKNYNKKRMKKLLTIIIIAGMTSFMACGPSPKEKALQAKLDSIAKQDSIAKSVQKVSYDFEQHGDIKVFIDDLAKAVNSDDKNSIAQMINFPLLDKCTDSYSQTPSLRCNDSKQFLLKYDKIFTSETKESIKNKKYRGYSTDFTTCYDVIKKGEYLIEDVGMYIPCIKKVNGKYKIYALSCFP